MEYELEYAKSNRACCKVCKANIEKLSLRIGTKQVDKRADGEEANKTNHILESTRWHHFLCFPKMRKKQWFAEHLTPAKECSGFAALQPEDQESVEALFEYCKGASSLLPEAPVPRVDPKTPAKPATRGTKRRQPETTPELQSSRPEENAWQGFNSAQLAELQCHEANLAKKSVAQLGAMLVKNGLSKTGKKEELVERIAECRVLGGLPLCPVCTKARLQWNRSSGLYSCPGRFDETLKRMLRCKGPAKGVEITRPAWVEDTDAFANDGVPAQNPSGAVDGNATASAEKSDAGKSQPPSLRQLLFSAPARHDGRGDDAPSEGADLVGANAAQAPRSDSTGLQFSGAVEEPVQALGEEPEPEGLFTIKIEEILPDIDGDSAVSAEPVCSAEPALGKAEELPPSSVRPAGLRRIVPRQVKRSKYFM